MKWFGINVTDHDAWLTEAMITPSRRFKIWTEYVLPAGEHSGNWAGNIVLMKNHAGTIIRRTDKSAIKGIAFVWPSDKGEAIELQRTYVNMGSVLSGVSDNAGWDVPIVRVGIDLLRRFALSTSKKETWETQAKSEYNYKARCEGDAISFWASLFAAHIDYPALEQHRVKIIDTFKKTRNIE